MINLNQYTSQLVKNFHNKFPRMVSDMQSSDHNEYSKNIFSEWHMEGDVWTHTMMVFSQMKTVIENDPALHLRKRELLITALLHDIGKPLARQVQEEKGKVTFYGHDSISTFLAVDIIDKIDPDITLDQKIFILRLINYHQLLFNITNNIKSHAIRKFADKFSGPADAELLAHVDIMRRCDYAGNLSINDDNINYPVIEQIINETAEKPALSDNVNGNTPTAYILVGLPGSGKSTYIADKLDSNITVVSRDNIIMKHAKLYEYNYTQAFHACDQKVVDRMFNEEFDDAIKAKTDIVIDRTNLTHKGRMKFITRLTQAKFNVIVVVLLPSYQTTLDRNNSRMLEGKNLDFGIIKSMMKNFNMPFANETDTVMYEFDY